MMIIFFLIIKIGEKCKIKLVKNIKKVIKGGITSPLNLK